ncbi:C-C motif chemokine 19-like [Centropristis striata]|uniref:C-C motif chemokine 19-like n=1 Tax=Centropristis striata TaxID=184440 RepID=UPI0027DF40C0|nr:C-C motif chemokine 19-like [Centropristis striata]
MAPWGDNKLFFCILFITCISLALAEVPSDCCLMVKNKQIHRSRVADYRQQVGGQGCSIDAMILVTRGGKKLCAPADVSWVHEVVKHVKQLKKDCRENNYQGKRCSGLNRE